METRNHKPRIRAKQRFIGPVVFACAFAVFCLGFGGLLFEAEALQQHREQASSSAQGPAAERVAQDADQTQAPQVKMYPVLFPPLLERAEGAREEEVEEKEKPAPAERTESEKEKADKAPAENAAVEIAETVIVQETPAQPVKRTKTVHHTAYKRVNHYKTVRHPASVARNVQVDGVDTIVWSQCPICGEHHERVYEQRVLDYYDEKPCAACGGKHDKGYDEVVEY